MSDSLQKELRLFESCRSGTIALADGLSQADSDVPPVSGGWSTGEVLSHLLIVEEKVRSQIALLIQLHRAGDEPDVSWQFRANSTVPVWIPNELVPVLDWPFTVFSRLLPSRAAEYLIRFPVFRFRAAEWARPKPYVPVNTLSDSLQSSLLETKRLFDSNEDCPWRDMILRHPSLGVNNVPRVLRILASHEQRHQDQIRRNRQDAKR